jgi:hypothetical protein
MPVGGAAGPAGGGLGVVPAMASPHPSAGAPVLLLPYFPSAEVNTAVDLLETELLNVYARAAQPRKLR